MGNSSEESNVDLINLLKFTRFDKTALNSFNTPTQFNLFTIISTYFNENTHNNILQAILSPETSRIGNIIILKKFLELLDLHEQINIFCSGKINVLREYRKIDLLITSTDIKGEKRAIIIENKINCAKDQFKQLIRYHKKILDEGAKVIKLVYLPRYRCNPYYFDEMSDDQKRLYKSISSKELCSFFKKLICDLSTLKNLVDGNLFDKNLAIHYLQHYMELVEKMTETEFSADSNNFRQIETVFNDPMSRQLLEDYIKESNKIKDFWSHRAECIFNILTDHFYKNPPLGFDVIDGALGTPLLGFKIKDSLSNVSGFYVWINRHPYNNLIQVGLFTESGNFNNKAPEDIMNSLKKIFLEISDENNILFEWQILKNWIYYNYDIDSFNSIKDAADFFKEFINKALEKIANNVCD